jgi:hypothetical protein
MWAHQTPHLDQRLILANEANTLKLKQPHRLKTLT